MMMRLNILILTLHVAASCFATAKEEVEFRSEAKLLVRFVVDRPGAKGDKEAPGTVNVEVVKLQSLELLRSVAKAIGSEQVLGRAEPGDKAIAKAALVIQKGLHVSASKASAVISLHFQHADPAIAQKVLEHLIKERFEQELRKHRGRPVDPDFAPLNIQVIQKPSEPRRIEADRADRLREQEADKRALTKPRPPRNESE